MNEWKRCIQDGIEEYGDGAAQTSSARVETLADGKVFWRIYEKPTSFSEIAVSHTGGIIPAGPTALADAKAAAEAAIQPVDPLDAEAKRLGCRWDGNSLLSNTCESGGGYVYGTASFGITTNSTVKSRDTARLALLAAVAVLLNKPAPAPAGECGTAKVEFPCPDGYRRTGEHRLPLKSEWYIGNGGHPRQASEDWHRSYSARNGARDILLPIPAPTPDADEAAKFAEDLIVKDADEYHVAGVAIGEFFSQRDSIDARRGIAAALREFLAERDKRVRREAVEAFSLPARIRAIEALNRVRDWLESSGNKAAADSLYDQPWAQFVDNIAAVQGS